MNTLDFAARVRNVEDAARHKDQVMCLTCGDTGWVVAVIRKDAVVKHYRIRDGKRVPVSCAALADRSELAGTASFEEMGPCPMCQRGWFEEFGDAEKQTKQPPVKPWWLEDKRGGTGSFWGPRDYVELVPMYSSEEGARRLSKAENAARMRALAAMFKGQGPKDMPE